MCACATSRSALLALVALACAAGCKINVGSIDVHLVYSAKDKDNPLKPADVTRIRVRVEGQGFAPREAEFSRGTGGGRAVLSEIPVGRDRRVIVEGLYSTGAVLSRGVSAPFDMDEGTTHLYLFISKIKESSGPPADTDPGFGARFRVRMRGSTGEQGRAFHTATLLPDGTVLVAGGAAKLAEGGGLLDPVEATHALRTAERFDPTAGAFIKEPALDTCEPDMDLLCLRRKRAFHGALLFGGDGRVMLVGGEPIGEEPHTEFFDPQTLRFVNGPKLDTDRSRAGVTVVPGALGGIVAVAGMDAQGGALESFELYNPDSGEFEPLAIDDIEERIGATAVAFQEGLALIGGWSGPWPGTPSDQVDMIRGESGQFVNTVIHLKEARAGHTATLIKDGKMADVLVCGGVNDGGTVSSTCEIVNLDPDSPGSELIPAMELEYERWGHTATLLDDGRTLLVAGGFRAWPPNPDLPETAWQYFERLDVLDRERLVSRVPLWLKSPRAGHSATLLKNGMVVLIGGLRKDNGDVPDPDYEIFNPE